MDIWEILGIEKTTDETLIKEAYFNQLKNYHPEEDPKGFQKLREAYETALKGEEKKEVTEFTVLIDELAEIYNDFEKRRDVTVWEKFLSDDLCNRIDAEEEALIHILQYLADNFRLPYYVWRLLNQHFGIKDRIDELSKRLPADFLDYIVGWDEYVDLIDHRKFEINPLKTAEDYENFIDLCREINRVFREAGEYDSAQNDENFKKLDEFELFNVDAEIMRCNHLENTSDEDKKDEVLALALNLYEKNPDDLKAMNALGNVYFAQERYTDGLEIFEKIIEKDSSFEGAFLGQANCYYGLEDYVTAKRIYFDYVSTNIYDSYASYKYFLVNEKLLPHYEEVLQKGEPYFEEDEELPIETIKIKLCSCYFNTHNYDKCIETLESFTPLEGKEEAYYSMLMDAYVLIDDYENSLKTIQKWKLLDVKEESERIDTLEVSVLLNLQRYEEAEKLGIELMEKYPDAGILYDVLAQILVKQDRLNEAVDFLNKGVKTCVENYKLYTTKAELEFRLGHYGEALDSCTEILNIYPYSEEAYGIKTGIFFYVGEYDKALEIAEQFERFELKNEAIDVSFYKACVYRQLSREKESIEILLRVAEKSSEIENKEESNDKLQKIYYELALCYEDIKEYDDAIVYIEKYADIYPDHLGAKMLRARFFRKKKEYQTALEIFDAIIAEFPDREIAFLERGLVYRDKDEREKAYEDLEKAIELNPKSTHVYKDIAQMYTEDEKYEDALRVYTGIIEEAGESHPYYYVSRGVVYGRMDRLEEQMNDYFKAVELDENYAWAYNNLGYRYYLDGKYDDAEKYYLIAIEKDDLFFNSYRILADVYMCTEKDEKAFEILTKAIEVFEANTEIDLESETISFYKDKINLFNHTGNFEEAEKLSKKALEKFPKVLDFYIKVTGALGNLNKLSEAEEYFNLAKENCDIEEKESDKTTFYRALANFYRSDVRDYDKAIKYNNEMIDLVKIKHPVHFYRAYAYLKSGQIKKAKEDFLIALTAYLGELEDYPDYAIEIQFKIGQCYVHTGDIEKAKESLEFMFDNSKNYRENYHQIPYYAYYLQFLILKAEDKKEEALEVLDKVIEMQPMKLFKDEREIYANENKTEINKSGKKNNGLMSKIINLFGDK